MTRSRLLVPLLVACLLAASAGAVAQSLTAGDVDDHLNWDHYLDYLERFGQQQTDLPFLSLHDRSTLLIHDRDGDPLGDARVTIATQTGNTSLHSGMNGIVHVLPGIDGLGTPGPATILVTAPDGTTQGFEADLSSPGPHTLTLDTNATPATKLDLMFTIDTTGSMSDELDYLTTELEGIVTDLTARHPNVDIRFGLVLYRDTTDDYTVRNLGFTNDLQDMQSRLAAQSAAGGGDYPEAMHAGLHEATANDWRSDAVRMLILVADAPPHAQHYDDFIQTARDARVDGIHIHPLAASGVADEAEYLMRAAAVLTGGRYMFLTDDSGIGNPHAEPSIPCYVVTSLDDLLVRIVASELTGTRIEADPQDIIRETGNYEMGVCLDDPDPQQVEDDPGQEGSSDDADASETAPTEPMEPTEPTEPTAPPGDTTTRSTYADTDGTGRHRSSGDTSTSPSTGGTTEADEEATPGPAIALALIGLAGLIVVARRRP